MTSNNERNKVYDLFKNLSAIIYIIGGPNFWPAQLKLPNFFRKIRKPVSVFMYALGILIIVLELCALYTQTNLSEKQKCDSIIWPFCHSIQYCFLLNALYYAETFKEILKILAIDMQMFNDEEIERATIKRMKYFIGFCLSLFYSTIILYGIDSFLQVIRYGK